MSHFEAKMHQIRFPPLGELIALSQTAGFKRPTSKGKKGRGGKGKGERRGRKGPNGMERSVERDRKERSEGRGSGGEGVYIAWTDL